MWHGAADAGHVPRGEEHDRLQEVSRNAAAFPHHQLPSVFTFNVNKQRPPLTEEKLKNVDNLQSTCTIRYRLLFAISLA